MKSRAITGFFFLAIMCTAILLDVITALVLFSFLGIIAIEEYRKMIAKPKWWRILWLFTIAIIWGIYGLLEKDLYHPALGALFLVQPIFLSLWVLDKRKQISTWNFSLLYPFFYIIFGFGSAILLAYSGKGIYNGFLLLSFFILQWCGDTFAYLTGKSFGKTKLYPSVSPNKTVEGLIGGIIFTVIAAYIMFKWLNTFALHHWMAAAVLVAVFGTLGDLIESKLKRLSGIKDSGKILPGHGGVLDRFDAMLISFPVVMVYLYIFAQ
jgi:phosphatidate cytidylyltransferase